jgi:hypothetical protein
MNSDKIQTEKLHLSVSICLSSVTKNLFLSASPRLEPYSVGGEYSAGESSVAEVSI